MSGEGLRISVLRCERPIKSGTDQAKIFGADIVLGR
jgi:hypothetical protein